jgi:hypothetical protein
MKGCLSLVAAIVAVIIILAILGFGWGLGEWLARALLP